MVTYGYVDNGGEATQDGPPLYAVELCSGAQLLVQTETEQTWFSDTKAKYLRETRFTDTTDLQDMDRLLCLELLIFRWNQHLASGFDYQQNMIEEDLIRRQVKDQSETITRIKQSLGLDKKSRDATLNEGNFASWLADAQRRARIFGMHRQNQLQKALVLMNELASIIDAMDRADQEERRKLGFESNDDIVKWVKETMLPEYKALDEYFVHHEQRLWERDL